MIDMFNADEIAVAVMLLIAAVGWSVLTVYSIWFFIAVRIEFKRGGGFVTAKQEATQSAMNAAKNNPELFQEAAKTGVQYAAQNPVRIKQ